MPSGSIHVAASATGRDRHRLTLAHLAFVAPPYPGHLDPMASLARELGRRGHRATFLHMEDARGPAEARGFAFLPVGAASHPPGRLAAMRRRMAGLNGLFGLPGLIRDVAETTDMLCRDGPGALRAIGADMLVCDATEAAGGLVGAHLGLPVVTVANALPLNREPAVPPPFTGWRYDPSRWGVERNGGGYRVSDRLMWPHAEIVAAWAGRWRLGERRTIEDCLSPLAEIAQLVSGLDFPRQTLPPTFHYCGPLRGGGLVPASFVMPAADGRPRGYASLGTLQGSRIGLFRRVADGARRAGLQLVLAHGGGLDEAQAASLPGRPAAFAFVPQAAVLAEAEVAILNGGLNTVLDALAAGVPVVVVPIAFEQGAIAARVERAGAGRALGRRFPTAGRLARTIERVRTGGSYRDAAARLRAEIAAAGGVRRAADIVERVLATGRPVTSADLPLGTREAA